VGSTPATMLEPEATTPPADPGASAEHLAPTQLGILALGVEVVEADVLTPSALLEPAAMAATATMLGPVPLVLPEQLRSRIAAEVEAVVEGVVLGAQPVAQVGPARLAHQVRLPFTI
jgi:hypothetical protein